MIDEASLAEIMTDYRAVCEKNLILERIAKSARTHLLAAIHGDLIEVEKTMTALNKALKELRMEVPDL